MDFGRVPYNELLQIDFSLPAEPEWNKQFLKGKQKKSQKVYVGCAKWGRKEWIGKIYPEGTRDAQFLDEYVKHYNSIELNATHYKLYDAAAIKKWAVKAKDSEFLFCPKVYQGISHFGSLSDKQFLTDSFLAGIVAFEDHLGPVFLQVSDKFGPKRKEELFLYIETLPKDASFFLEVRHPDWFQPPQFEDLLKAVKRSNLGMVITDTAGRRDCCHMHLSQSKVFIRFVGNSLHATDYIRIDSWIERMKYWLESGINEIYFFMHMHDEAFSPELSVYLVEKLNAAAGLKLKTPAFVAKQGR